jgi:hypothetical protein
MERAKGIEPSYAAWEAAVLPLNYARDHSAHLISRDRAPRQAGWRRTPSLPAFNQSLIFQVRRIMTVL